MAKPKLLPAPKVLRERKGSFRIEPNLPVIVGPGEDPALNAAWSFAGEAEHKAAVFLPVERMGKLDGIPRRVLFLLEGRHERLYPPLRKLTAKLAKAPAEVRDQAYVLDITKDQVVAAAASPRGLYYAAQTLRQLLSVGGALPCLSITDWPTYLHRGVMLDISRFKVPTLETLFALVERLASMKINVFQLYTEHSFVFRRHPEIGRNCGSMSAEDIFELDHFCKEHFVDLNANLQSFGHHRHLLSIPKYNALAEKPDEPWTLCPGDPRTYHLLDDLYAECLPAYSSTLFNASCDETWELGKGRSRKRAERIGLGRVYLGHIQKIHRLARKYGKRMMIWADIALQYPDLIPEIPRDIVMLDWGYDKNCDLSGLEQLRAAGLEHWTCPGVSNWRRIFCDVDNACGNIARRAVGGVASGATGLLNTDWGDDGHAQLLSASFHGYAWGAEQSWTPSERTAPADFDRRFAWAWFADDSGRFGKLYRLTGLINKDTVSNRPARPFELYWERFPCRDVSERLPAAELRRRHELVRKALALIPKLADTDSEHHEVLRDFLFGLGQMFFIEAKIEVSKQLDAWRESGKKKLPPKLRRAVRELLKEWRSQREEFEELWMRDNRRSEIAYRLGLYRRRSADYRRLLR